MKLIYLISDKLIALSKYNTFDIVWHWQRKQRFLFCFRVSSVFIFFLRQQDKRAQLRRCNKNDHCRISVKTRNHCQPCRLRRCLELGMAKEAARLGRRSRKTWKHLDFTIAKHSREIDQHDGSSQMNSNSSTSPLLTSSSTSTISEKNTIFVISIIRHM